MGANDRKVGAVTVIGGGIGGMQASLDLAESGLKVYLVEQGPSIGGVMAQLDKTFPTNDCAMCTLSPKMVDCGRHMNIEKLTYSEVEGIEGSAGNFKVRVRRKSRYVDVDKCTGCGDCMENCPVSNRLLVSLPPVTPPRLDTDVQTWVEETLAKYNGNARGALLPILQDVNRHYRYLPRDIIEYVSWSLGIPVSSVLRVATFYNVFSLTPRGRHTISVCLGTACFVKGSGMLLERLERELGIKEGETTEDLRFSVEGVRCIGCCALAPALRIDGETYAHVRQRQIPSILSKYE